MVNVVVAEFGRMANGDMQKFSFEEGTTVAQGFEKAYETGKLEKQTDKEKILDKTSGSEDVSPSSAIEDGAQYILVPGIQSAE